MKKLALIVALLTLVAFASGVMAQPKPAPATAPAPAAPAPEKAKAPEKTKAVEKPMKFSGVVEKVDEMAKTIIVKGKKESMTFATDDKTKITKGKDTIGLADVKGGMNVAIDYKKEGDKNLAAAVKVSAPKAAPKAAAPAEKKEKPAEAPKEAPKK